MGRHDWRSDARCKGQNPEFFFDKFEMDEEPHLLRKEITDFCLECPVRRECMKIAIARDPYGYKIEGVYAGLYWRDGQIVSEFNAHVDLLNWTERMTND